MPVAPLALVPRRPSVAAVLAVVALGGAGCGGSSDEGDVRAVVERFGAATAAKDYQRICDELIARTLVESVEAVGLPCELAFRRGLESVEEPSLTVGEIDVNRSKALAQVETGAKGQPPSQDTLELVLEGGEWKVSALARPQPQPPATRSPER